MSEAKLVERIVAGRKPYSYVDPTSGERIRALPGEKVLVSLEACEAFSDRLVAPAVAEAQAKAQEAIKAEREAREQAEAEEREARRADAANRQKANKAKAEADKQPEGDKKPEGNKGEGQ